MPRRRTPLTLAEHEALAARLDEIDATAHGIIFGKLNGRVRCATIDAAMKIDHAILRARFGLEDVVERHVPGACGPVVYRRPQHERMEVTGKGNFNPEEHRGIAAALLMLREKVQFVIGPYSPDLPKPVCRRLVKVERAIDSLRARLDGEFAKRHPADFSTRVYYPGPAAAEGR